ncbi:hypothetical protein [Natronococcus occultus]|uniref:Uncharacterized protein n=1 Tax=Natronococcus occultus SP4 TaxID=694430 RepID=L0JYJ9_9EURY|nr:hypothetical protein [Natronococcus occultus]AGB36928.1 hypothetical protein Natoc_1090 [Natronococcus occultus SP4]
MTERSGFDPDRRTVLGTTAGVLAVGAAGCTALEDDTHPQLEELDVGALQETVAEQSEAGDGAVTLGVGFADDNLPITSELYEPNPAAEISDTEQYDTQELSEIDLLEEPTEELPTIDTDEIELYALELSPGETRTMGLTVRSDEDVGFDAHLPEGEPYDPDDGLVLNCYCIDEVWNVPADGTWTRVIEIGLEDGIEDPESAAMVYGVFEE